MVKNVLVVGGGPAGLTLATALRRRGIESEIVESNDSLRPLGSGLTMMGPTLRAMHAVTPEALRQCLHEGAGHDALHFADSDGVTLQSVPLPAGGVQGLPGGFGIMRPVFWGILATMAQQAGAPIRLCTTVSALHQDPDGVDVEFSDGAQGRYDLVVGADGIHSVVRGMVFPDAPTPHDNGQTIWRSVVPRPTELSDDMTMFYGKRNKAGFNPVSATRAYVFLVENAIRRPRPPREQWPELVREQLADYGGLIGWARERMTDPALVDCHIAQVLLVPSPWFQRRVVLIGDAVHATTPHLAMGAGIAIEDGLVLAEVLSSGGFLDDALARFMKRRFERCRLVVENSAQLGAWEQDPSVPPSEHARLSDESFAALAQPI